jgi:hypothetical protein
MPMPSTTVVVVLVVLLVAGWYLSFSAARLDRMHARAEGASNALDAQLVRRASVALQVATSGRLDPASSLLVAGAAGDAREASQAERELAESDLTAALRAALGAEIPPELLRDPAGCELVVELASACRRVELSRRFHNEAVRAARVVRRKWVVRFLRLAGRAGWPTSFEMDDTPPEALLQAAEGPASTVVP